MPTTDPDTARQQLAEIAEEETTLPARKRAIVRAAKEAGVPPVEIAFTLGVSVTTVYNWLKPTAQ